MRRRARRGGLGAGRPGVTSTGGTIPAGCPASGLLTSRPSEPLCRACGYTTLESPAVHPASRRAYHPPTHPPNPRTVVILNSKRGKTIQHPQDAPSLAAVPADHHRGRVGGGAVDAADGGAGLRLAAGRRPVRDRCSPGSRGGEAWRVCRPRASAALVGLQTLLYALIFCVVLQGHQPLHPHHLNRLEHVYGVGIPQKNDEAARRRQHGTVGWHRMQQGSASRAAVAGTSAARQPPTRPSPVHLPPKSAPPINAPPVPCANGGSVRFGQVSQAVVVSVIPAGGAQPQEGAGGSG